MFLITKTQMAQKDVRITIIYVQMYIDILIECKFLASVNNSLTVIQMNNFDTKYIQSG